MNAACGLLLFVASASACLTRPGGTVDPSSLYPAIDWQVIGPQMNLPGHKGYNPSTQTCCKGKVFNNPSLRCCGSGTLDPISHVCCDGEAVAKVSGQVCCGKTLYDQSPKANNMCCYGKVHHLEGDQVGHVACCGKELYRPGSQTCCGDSSKGEGIIAPILEGRNMSCCDKKAYNEDTEVCCLEYAESGPEVWESTIIPLEGNKRDCCGGKGFDVSTDMCCVSVIVNRNLECCGALGYDPKTEACCVHPPPEGSKYPGVSKIPKPDEDTKCCNGQAYKMSTQSCCDGGTKVEDNPKCSRDIYVESPKTTTKPLLNEECSANSRTDLCCGGIKVSKESRSDVCCYDVQTDEPILPWIKPRAFWG